jgi:hypothetical protein
MLEVEEKFPKSLLETNPKGLERRTAALSKTEV